MYPLVSVVKLTPRLTELLSPASTVDGAADPKMLHGQCGAVPSGVARFDTGDGGPVPTPFVAVTVNVYVVPFVSPLTVAVGAGGEPVMVAGFWAVLPTNGVTW
jgi:hypothetical protein